MLRVVVVAAFLALATAAPFITELDGEWKMFKMTYKKVYSAEEEVKRRTIWEENLKYIQSHNLETARGQHSFTLGMNRYGDMTVEEVVTGYKMSDVSSTGSTFLSPSNTQLPDAIDWRTHGYVTPVMNQEFLLCGSCWAFSATGALEGQHFRKTGKLVSLSEQNLVDCSGKEGNHGCEGGLMDQAFRYIQINNGIDTEASYPYQAENGECRFNATGVGATVTGVTDVQRKNETALQVAVASVGPVSIAMDAVHLAFLFYRSGVYYERTCREDYLSHAMLVVGYGSENGADYWLVKNSMGTEWGMDGYIKMSRNRNNNCGIATQASYPLV